jgi:hypothetical protein
MSNLPTKEEVLAKIKADPGSALADIELLKKQLVAERLIGDSQNGVANYFASIAQDYQRKYWFCKKRLIRARILVRELKKAVIGNNHDDFSANKG